MSKLLIVSQYNKLMKVAEAFDYNAPFDDKLNVFEHTEELERICKKYDVAYYCLSLSEYTAMAGR